MSKQPSHKDQIFNTQIGQSATVQREVVKSDQGSTANHSLAMLGESLNPLPSGLKHMGSAAMHIYWNETLEQVYFVQQMAPLKDCPEQLALAGSKDFMGTMIESYGHKRPKLRSGF